jgi:hypothetical protein
MTTPNCGTCRHWDLAGTLGQHGYGQCAKRVLHLREAITTSAQHICRIGKFSKAEPKVVREREMTGGPLL